MERKPLVQIDVPPEVGASLEEATNHNAIRRYVYRRGGGTLPGDIEVHAEPYGFSESSDATGFTVTVFEQPNLPESVLWRTSFW